MIRASALVLAWGLLSAFSCTVEHEFHAPDIPIAKPPQAVLEGMQARFEAGEKELGDPRKVAHDALLRNIPEAPWRYQPYRADDYEFKQDRPDWGPYVVRGYATRDLVRRYRVKVRAYRSVWYPVEVSHYALAEMPHPALEDEE